MRDFRLLTADEIECRIAEISKKGNKLSLLLYKTARTDAALLDEIVGKFRWQNRYQVIDGKLFCSIGIKADNGEWIWKGNVGTESNMEAEKGQASDAMKRAGFVWGIGTELYSSPRIDVWADKCNIKDYNGKFKCYDSFSVKEIEYDSQERICKLVIFNNTLKKECFRWELSVQNPPEELDKDFDDIRCESCGNSILPYYSEGKRISVEKHVAGSMERYGKKFCIKCIRKMQVAQAQVESKPRHYSDTYINRDAENYAETYMHEDAGDRE